MSYQQPTDAITGLVRTDVVVYTDGNGLIHWIPCVPGNWDWKVYSTVKANAAVFQSSNPAVGTITTLPTTLSMTFSAAMGASAGVAANWSAISSNGTITVTAASVSGSTVTLTLSYSGVTTGSQVIVRAGNSVADANGFVVSVSNTYTYSTAVAAVFQSSSPAVGTIGSVPTSMALTFSSAMGASAGTAANWSVASTTGTVTVTAASVSGSTVTLTLSSTGVYSGSTLTLTSSGILDSNGNAVSVSNAYSYYNNAVGTITGLPFLTQATTSTWNQLLPSSPTLWSSSTTVLTNLMNASPNGGLPHGNKVDIAQGNIGHMYYLTGTDPTVTITNTGGYGDLSGSGIPMPTSAQAAGNSDGHLVVLNTTTGAEYDYYQFNTANTTIAQGASISCTASGKANYLTGSGWDEGIGPNGTAGSLTTSAGGIVTSAGATLMAGVVTIDELQSGVINHKIAMAVGANWGAPGVWPATAAAKFTPSGQTATGVGIGPGSLIWSDLTDAQVDALTFDKFSKMLLKALHNYGGFIIDQNGYSCFDIRQVNVVQQGNSTGSTTASSWYQTNANAGSPAIMTQTAAWYEAHWHVVDPSWLQTFSNSQR